MTSKVFVKVWFQDGFYLEKDLEQGSEWGLDPLIAKHGLITDLIIYHDA